MAKRSRRQRPTNNATTRAYREFWESRDRVKCEGKHAHCNSEPSSHEKHMARRLPADYDNPCVIKQCNPRHAQYRYPENVGLAGLLIHHYLECVHKATFSLHQKRNAFCIRSVSINKVPTSKRTLLHS